MNKVYEDGLPTPQRYFAMVSAWLTLSIAMLDGSMVSVALLTISREFDVPPASSIWAVNAYQLVITVALLPLAALSERVGYRRVNLIGIAVFTVGSLTCALAQDMQMLIAARALEGLGGAAVMSTNPALVRHIYPQRLLGRGIGLNGVVIALSSVLGPSLASAILAHGSWRWLFLVNLPLALVALALGWKSLPRSEKHDRPFDLISTVLNALTFGFMILGADSLVREGLLAGLWKLGVAGLAGVFLVRRELQRPIPLVPFDLLRIPILGLSVATSTVAFAAQTLALVSLPFYFQTVQARSAVETGLLLTPWPAAVCLTAPVAGWLADRYGPAILGACGLGLSAAGLGALAVLQPGAATPDIAWRLALCGVGFVIFQQPNNRTMIASAPRSRAGAAGGLLASARTLGQTIGALGVALYFHMVGLEHAGAGVLVVAAVLACGAALVSLTRLRIAAAPAPGPSPSDA